MFGAFCFFYCVNSSESGELENEDDDDWEFAPVQTQAPTLSPEDQNKSVQKLVENWLQSLGSMGPMGAQSMTQMLGGGMGMVRGEVDENLVTDWDSWLQSANIPGEAHELITNGMSSEKVPVVPFAKLGVKAEQATFGTRVRDNFWQVLGKHLQLPSAKPEPSSPGSPGSPGAGTHGTQHQSDVKGPGDAAQTVHCNQSVEPGAGTAEAASMVADWGLLETVACLQLYFLHTKC